MLYYFYPSVRTIVKKVIRSLSFVLLFFLCICPVLASQEIAHPYIAEVVGTLEATHPKLQDEQARQALTRKAEELDTTFSSLSVFEQDLAIQELVASLGDSHTTLGNIALHMDKDITVLPFSTTTFEGSYHIALLDKNGRDFLGWKLEAINGHDIQELLQRFSPLISHDNQVKLRRQLPNFLTIPLFLEEYGISGSDGTVRLTLSHQGRTVHYRMYPISRKEARQLERVTLAELRTGQPPTERTDTNYWWSVLADAGIYVQYNVCAPDKNYPMAAMAAEIRNHLEIHPDVPHVIIDLRYNGGGSDGVLNPLRTMLLDFPNLAVYAMVAEQTYSSAIINAIQLKEQGAILVGEETSGSVDHYGSVARIELSSGMRLNVSTKNILLSDMFPTAKSYGHSPIKPDYMVPLTLEDYLRGRDTAVEAIMKGLPVKE